MRNDDRRGDGFSATPGGRWQIRERRRVAEVLFGEAEHSSQFAAFHLKSGYFRLVPGPGSSWGTSVVLLPTLWEAGGWGPVQGAPITLHAAEPEGENFVLSFSARIASLRVAGRVRIHPPEEGSISAQVEVTTEGEADLEAARPWDMFKPLMLSSMWAGPDRWDASAALFDGASVSLSEADWIAAPPVPAQTFGLRGGFSQWQRRRRMGPAPTVDITLEESMPVTGWLTPDHNVHHDNVAMWPVCREVLRSWRYRVTARQGP